MTKTQAIDLAVLAFSDAKALVVEADAIQPREASDPSGADDYAKLAQADKAARLAAATGRVQDGLIALRREFGAAFDLPPATETFEPTPPVGSPGGPVVAPPPVVDGEPAGG